MTNLIHTGFVAFTLTLSGASIADDADQRQGMDNPASMGQAKDAHELALK